jgi:hypothetical protein
LKIAYYWLHALICRYRTTARIWDLETKEIIKVIDMGTEAKVIKGA